MSKKTNFFAAAKVALTTIGIVILTFFTLLVTSIILVTKEVIEVEKGGSA